MRAVRFSVRSDYCCALFLRSERGYQSMTTRKLICLTAAFLFAIGTLSLTTASVQAEDAEPGANAETRKDTVFEEDKVTDDSAEALNSERADKQIEPQKMEDPEEPEDSDPVRHVRYINGGADGRFLPENAMNRAELAKIIYDLGDYTAGEASFPDVEEGRYFTTPVNALAAAGVLHGYDDGSFRPYQPVTRAELVTILQRLCGEHTENACSFEDVPDGRFFSEAVAVAQENGWVNGYSDGTFRPFNEVSRAEAVTMVNRFLGRKADRETVDAHPELRFFPDVGRGSWYYYEVMEASIEHTALISADGSEQWTDTTPYALTQPDGFYCWNGNLYLVRDRQFVNTAQSGTFDGIAYTCTGASGICTAEGERLLTANGWLVLIEGGTPVWQPGELETGLYLHLGKLYYASDGIFLHQVYDGTDHGMAFHCSENGVCSMVGGGFLILANGERYHMVNGAFDSRTGLVEIDGSMYYLRSLGHLLCGGVWNSLYFDSNGRYTSGNAKIDAYIDTILSRCTKSSMTQMQKLRAVYEYFFYHMVYQSHYPHVPLGADPSTWCEEAMLRLIARGKGNCYCYASAMYFSARRLGFWDARAISGQIADAAHTWVADHGWLELTINGVKTVTDPELEAKRYATPGHVYLKPYEQTPWPYYPYY